jgi:hypothetical protein
VQKDIFCKKVLSVMVIIRFKQLAAAVVILIGLTVIVTNYAKGVTARQRAIHGRTMLSPSNEYRVEKYYISSGEPMALLFRVFDRNGNLLAEYTRESWPGAATETWVCDAGHCTELYFETGDTKPLAFPPTWLDRMRAKIP